MSVGKAAKSGCEFWQHIWRDYQRVHPGPFRPRAVVDWAIDNGLADLPKVNPKSVLVRRFKRAAREIRIKDPQGRAVREMLPAKLPVVDENGNLFLDLRYDHIHTMSAGYARLAFEQRDENIAKQKHAATRDLQSFIENNPNAKGHESQFVFDFMVDAPAAAVVEKIEESPHKPGKPR